MAKVKTFCLSLLLLDAVNHPQLKYLQISVIYPVALLTFVGVFECAEIVGIFASFTSRL